VEATQMPLPTEIELFNLKLQILHNFHRQPEDSIYLNIKIDKTLGLRV
jgi:hypothetical protein